MQQPPAYREKNIRRTHNGTISKSGRQMSSASAESDSNVLFKGSFKLLRAVTLARNSLSPSAFNWIHCIHNKHSYETLWSHVKNATKNHIRCVRGVFLVRRRWQTVFRWVQSVFFWWSPDSRGAEGAFSHHRHSQHRVSCFVLCPFLTSARHVTVEVVAGNDCFCPPFPAMWTRTNSVVGNASHVFNGFNTSNSLTSLYLAFQGTLVSNAIWHFLWTSEEAC